MLQRCMYVRVCVARNRSNNSYAPLSWHQHKPRIRGRLYCLQSVLLHHFFSPVCSNMSHSFCAPLNSPVNSVTVAGVEFYVYAIVLHLLCFTLFTIYNKNQCACSCCYFVFYKLCFQISFTSCVYS